MNRICRLRDIPAQLRRTGRRLGIAVVAGTDDSTLEAVTRACSEGSAEALMVGDEAATREALSRLGLPAAGLHFLPARDGAEAAALAVEAVRDGRANVLMKGLVGTSTLLRAVLNKEHGLLPPGGVLSHVAVTEWEERLLLFGDVAVIPYPTLEQRRAIVGYLVAACHALGIDLPRVALLHCSETVSEHFPHTLDYGRICAEYESEVPRRAIVDGPLDLRTAIDSEALRIKGIDSPLEGRSDALVFADIEAGNVFYKTVTHMVGAETAGMLVGTTCPVVLPSRGDDARTKFYSLALAALVGGAQ